MSLSEQYLLSRGVPLEVATVNGIEIDLEPSRDRTESRLGVGCVPLWKVAVEILWFRAYSGKDRDKYSWVARALPTIDGHPKFVAPTKKSGFHTGSPTSRFASGTKIGKPSRPDSPLVITEGPIKRFVLVALIGSLSGTLADRSIEIRMERKTRGQKVSPLRATPPEKRRK